MSNIAERSLHTRIARSVDAIRRSFVDNLFYVTGRTFDNATVIDHYTALVFTIRDRLLVRDSVSGEDMRIDRWNPGLASYMKKTGCRYQPMVRYGTCSRRRIAMVRHNLFFNL